MKKLQKKMIGIAFLSVILVFSILVAGLNFTVYWSNTNRADAMTMAISFNGGHMPRAREFDEKAFEEQTDYRINLNAETEFRTRYFTVETGTETGEYEVHTEHISSMDEETAKDMADYVIANKRKTGYLNEYRYRITGDIESPDYVIFLDWSDYLESQRITLHIAIVVSLIFAILVSVIFASLSSRILRPFEQNQKAQKQFITDAGHELKTPLAIISANAEVLKYKNGDNEWTQNIISQAGHMGKLINQLLILSRMEEYADADKREAVNMTTIINESLGKFSGVLESKGAKLEKKLGEEICICAVKNQMENLVDILIENASKYVSEEGRVYVELEKTGKRVQLKVFNTAETGEEFDTERIFDRFYRTDRSRTSSTGGHGIGLSIARRIVRLHKGSISAKAENDGVMFTVIL